MKISMDDAAILAIKRPDKSLWTYYLLCCLVFPPLFPFMVLPMWFRYHSMKYHFTDEGISMSWGILFRHETILNYARIQDIHLRSNIVERWLGLARILVQTASGSASAELTLEGLKEFEAVRNFLYSKMRGVKDATQHQASPPAANLPAPLTATDADELAATGFNFNAEAGGAGVEGVFKKLFDHRSGAVDHFAGSDLVGDLVGKNADAPHKSSG